MLMILFNDSGFHFIHNFIMRMRRQTSPNGPQSALFTLGTIEVLFIMGVFPLYLVTIHQYT